MCSVLRSCLLSRFGSSSLFRVRFRVHVEGRSQNPTLNLELQNRTQKLNTNGAQRTQKREQPYSRGRQFFLQQLLPIELGVHTVARDKLIVRSPLNDLPIVEHENLIRAPNG
jgi:hypothetical protein